jgi:hypothetical protein
MTPSSLLNVPSHLLHNHAGRDAEGSPMATTEERRWAYAVCVALAILGFVLLVVLQ